MLLVQGDTTTDLCCGARCVLLRYPVGHIEAGLRRGRRPSVSRRDQPPPHASGGLPFCSHGRCARSNLLLEGVSPEDTLVSGNTVVDALFLTQARLTKEPTLAVYCLGSTKGLKIILVTAHRRESFGLPFRRICEAIRALAEKRPDVLVVYPVQLNPNVQAPVHEILGGCPM